MPSVPPSSIALSAQDSPNAAQSGRPSLGTDNLVQKICHLAEHEIRHHHAQLNTEWMACLENSSRPSQVSPEKETPIPVRKQLSTAPQNDLGEQTNSKEQTRSKFQSKPRSESSLSQAGHMSALFQSSIAPHLQTLHDLSNNNEQDPWQVSSSKKSHLTHAEKDKMMRERAKSHHNIPSSSFSPFAANQADIAVHVVSKRLARVVNKRVAYVVKSRTFDNLCGLIILANAITIGVSTNTMVSSKNPSYSPWMQVVSYSFTVCFTVEIIARIYVDRMEFFKGVERGWNLFDFAIILVAIMDVLFHIFLSGGEIERSLGVVSVLRSFRAFRIVRLMRSFRALRPLRLLLSGIVGTLSHCCWALILLSLIIYLFGVTFTHAAVQHLYSEYRDLPSESRFEGLGRPTMEDLFGSLLRSMNTLSQSICGGMNWDVVIEALQETPTSGSIYIVVFLLYIGFVYLGMLNVLTALFCQQAVENAMGDQEIVLEGRLSAMRQMENKLKKIFRELDELDQSDDSPEGMFTFAELEEFMEDPRIKAQFALLGIVPEDAWTLFKLLDPQENGLVDTDSFISGCMRLRGEATRMDVMSLASHTRSLEELIMDFVEDFDAMTQSATGAVPQSPSSRTDKPDGQGFSAHRLRKQRLSMRPSSSLINSSSPPGCQGSTPGELMVQL